MIWLIVFGFIAQYIDKSLGLGYGTTLAPVLFWIGLSPIEVIPAVLLSETVIGLIAGYSHHQMDNVDFSFNSTNITFFFRSVRRWGLFSVLEDDISPDLKKVLLFTGCSLVGSVVSVFLALQLTGFWIKLYVGVLVFLMGIILLVSINKKFSLSWLRMIILGFIASFNKGLAGGGYGPVVTGGQIMSGVDEKTAVGVTTFAEALTGIFSLATYILLGSGINWQIALYLVLGGLISAPLAALTVKRLAKKNLRAVIGVASIIVGIITIIKVI